MTKASQDEHPPSNPEPRWPALMVVLASGGLYTALPDILTVGPRWLFPCLVLALLLPTIFTHRTGHHRLKALLGVVITGLLTAGLLLALLLLIAALPGHKEPPTALLISAVALWTTNMLVFALWYWRFDAGGPHVRERRAGHPDGAFLFGCVANFTFRPI